jgi:hypothetical protein
MPPEPPEVDPADERRHEPGPEPLWGESWYFDFFSADGSVAGWLRLGLYPNLGVAWYHALLTGVDRATVAVIDTTAPIPKGDQLRAPGLWADHDCRIPLDHWQVANEAHAIEVDDPLDLYAAEPRGRVVPMALDLEWETAGTPYHYGATTRYEIPCLVHGEINVGDERLHLEGRGQRDHSWGVRDWWQFGWCWTSGWLDDGLRFHGSDIRIPDVDIGFGYVQPATGPMVTTNQVHASETLGDSGLPTAGVVAIGDLDLTLDPVGFAPVLLLSPPPVRASRFPRAVCRVTAAGGRPGWCWAEWNQPRGSSLA